MVTSHDVARLAGVSQPTVSRALRALPGTSAETIDRVRAAAAALGYVPSEAGRSLSTNRTRCIGIVAAELTNPFYPELVEPIRSELEMQGYRTLLIPDSADTPLEIGRLADATLDGVILTTASSSSRLPFDLSAREIPFVLVNRTVDGIDADNCSFDNRGGAEAVAHLLVDAGHTEVSMIAGPPTTSTGRERAEAFRGAMNDRGVPLQTSRVLHGAYSFEAGFESARHLLSRDPRPTAIFCGNDVIAIGAINALVAGGLKPGRDVAVAGFDNIAMAAWNVFDLTTVHCDLIELARSSVHLLMRRIKNPSAATVQKLLPTHLVERSSTLDLSN